MRAVETMKVFREKGSAYLQLQSTRPQTIGYALSDSPVGQAAWIYDIINSGTGNVGRPEDAVSRDKMLDEITLFWLTDTAASSARIYLEQAQLMGKRNNPGRVEPPVGVSVFPNDMPPARSWAPLVYPQLFYWHELDRGATSPSSKCLNCLPRSCASAFGHFTTPDSRLLKGSKNHDAFVGSTPSACGNPAR
jgi:epoxide hydrolase